MGLEIAPAREAEVLREFELRVRELRLRKLRSQRVQTALRLLAEPFEIGMVGELRHDTPSSFAGPVSACEGQRRWPVLQERGRVEPFTRTVGRPSGAGGIVTRAQQ